MSQRALLSDAPRPLGGAFVLWRALPALVGPAIAVAYLGAAMLGQWWYRPELGLFSPVWPAAGVAAGLLVAFGRRWWPAIVAGAFVETLLHGMSVGGSVVLALTTAGEALMVAAVLRPRDGSAALSLETPTGVAVLGAGGAAAAAVTAALGALVLRATQQAPPAADFGALWRAWWLSDTLAILLVTPVIVTWSTPRSAPDRPSNTWLEAGALGLGALLSGVLLFLGPASSDRVTQPAMVLLVPFVVWAAVRFGARGAAAVGLLFTAIAVVGVTFGPDAGQVTEVTRALFLLQGFGAVLVLTGCVLGGAISAREIAERLAAGRDDQLRRLVTAVPSVLFRFTARRDGVFELRFLTEGTERVVGYHEAELEKDFNQTLQLIHAPDRSRVAAGIGAAVVQGTAWSDEFRVRAADGGLRWIRGQAAPEALPGTPDRSFWSGVMTDITAEQSAAFFETEQQRVLEALATGSSRVEALESIVRLVEAQYADCYSTVWLLDPADGTMRVACAPRAPRELLALADGRRVAARESLLAEALATGTRILVEDIQADERGALLMPAVRAKGVQAAWIVPFLGRGGRPLGAVSTYFLAPRRVQRGDHAMLDAVSALAGLVVQRFDADRARREVEDQLERAQRMESLGRLAGGIAHDFNNLLTVIMNSAFLLEDASPEHRPSEDVALIRSSASRAAGLVRQLLAFGRRQPWTPTPCQLRSVIERLLPVLRGALGERHALRLELEADVPDVLADVAQLEQVIVNLVINARDAMEALPGEVTLRVEPFAERGVRLVVRDTGIGMGADVRARIFEPFFTTKAPGQGSGLGLSMVFAIVERSGGVVRVESAPDAGATFLLEWPGVTPPRDVVGASSVAERVDQDA